MSQFSYNLRLCHEADKITPQISFNLSFYLSVCEFKSWIIVCSCDLFYPYCDAKVNLVSSEHMSEEGLQRGVIGYTVTDLKNCK